MYRGRQLCFTLDLEDSLQIGRARPGEPDPPSYDPDTRRLVIAPLSDKLVSREHVRLERNAATDPTAGSDDARLVDTVSANQ